MSNVWKIWIGLLAAASLYGFVLIGSAQSAADLNEALASGAPQQTVVGLWHIRDLTTIVIYEVIILIVLVASVGVALLNQKAQLPERSAPPKHAAEERPDEA